MRQDRREPRADPAKLGDRSLLRDQLRRLDGPAKGGTAGPAKCLTLPIGTTGFFGRETEQLAQLGVAERVSR
jgi:hypothetical protein